MTTTLYQSLLFAFGFARGEIELLALVRQLGLMMLLLLVVVMLIASHRIEVERER
jgi:hypothetical protein